MVCLHNIFLFVCIWFEHFRDIISAFVYFFPSGGKCFLNFVIWLFLIKHEIFLKISGGMRLVQVVGLWLPQFYLRILIVPRIHMLERIYRWIEFGVWLLILFRHLELVWTTRHLRLKDPILSHCLKHCSTLVNIILYIILVICDSVCLNPLKTAQIWLVIIHLFIALFYLHEFVETQAVCSISWVHALVAFLQLADVVSFKSGQSCF